jgi:hypothetical protein
MLSGAAPEPTLPLLALAGTLLPARCATAIDPTEALRAESGVSW